MAWIATGINEITQIWIDVMEWTMAWFANPNFTPMAQIITALTWGIVLSPWSMGLIFLIGSVVAYEVWFWIITRFYPELWNSSIRAGVVCASILGYIIGRTLSGDNILMTGLE